GPTFSLAAATVEAPPGPTRRTNIPTADNPTRFPLSPGTSTFHRTVINIPESHASAAAGAGALAHRPSQKRWKQRQARPAPRARTVSSRPYGEGAQRPAP